jgi:hypothetical protein
MVSISFRVVGRLGLYRPTADGSEGNGDLRGEKIRRNFPSRGGNSRVQPAVSAQGVGLGATPNDSC